MEGYKGVTSEVQCSKIFKSDSISSLLWRVRWAESTLFYILYAVMWEAALLHKSHAMKSLHSKVQVFDLPVE